MWAGTGDQWRRRSGVFGVAGTFTVRSTCQNHPMDGGMDFGVSYIDASGGFDKDVLYCTTSLMAHDSGEMLAC